MTLGARVCTHTVPSMTPPGVNSSPLPGCCLFHAVHPLPAPSRLACGPSHALDSSLLGVRPSATYPPSLL